MGKEGMHVQNRFLKGSNLWQLDGAFGLRKESTPEGRESIPDSRPQGLDLGFQ